MSDETNTQKSIKDYTPAELEALRQSTIAGYEEKLPVLRLRAEYYTLNAEIEVQETRRLLAIAQRYSLQGRDESGKKPKAGTEPNTEK